MARIERILIGLAFACAGEISMNEEHVKIVKSGQLSDWHARNPHERLDLSGADLSGANLRGADLSGANLDGALLISADLRNAELGEANLSRAVLTQAMLIEANLGGAYLKEADLRQANLRQALLIGSDLSNSDLFAANLVLANLTDAILCGADFLTANLSGANFTGADLTDANLLAAIMLKADLTGATLTGANLYGTARDDWKIEGVICTHIFWESGKRSPKDRDLEPGEFERRYTQLPTIEYVFENGLHPLDTLIMDRIVQAINDRNPEFELQIDSLHTRGINPTITFNVKYDEQKTVALQAVTEGYGLVQAKLYGHQNLAELLPAAVNSYEVEKARLEGQIDSLQYMIDRLIGRDQTSIKDSIVAIGGSTINMGDYIGHLEEIQKAIADVPEESIPADVRREALDAVTDGFKALALGKVKEAAKGVTEKIAQLGIEAVTKTRGFEALADLVD